MVESLVKRHSRKLKKDTLSIFFKANSKIKKLKPIKFGFMPPLTNSIKTIYKKSKLFDVVFTSNTKLKQILGTVKDKRPELEQSGTYKITCICGNIYVGQSKRQVLIRYKEHISAIKNQQNHEMMNIGPPPIYSPLFNLI